MFRTLVGRRTGRNAGRRRGLKERLDAGETILCAEGYLLFRTRVGRRTVQDAGVV